jgi:hypothetical protein
MESSSVSRHRQARLDCCAVMIREACFTPKTFHVIRRYSPERGCVSVTLTVPHEVPQMPRF